MGQDRSQRCQITLCWCILPPECQRHRWSSTHDGLRAMSEKPDSLAYMANGKFQPAWYWLVPGHCEHQEQHQTQRKSWGISWHARCCSSHLDCQGTNPRWEHPGPLHNQQRDPHQKMYSFSRNIRPRCCTNQEQTKTTKGSSTNTTRPHMETQRFEWHKCRHGNNLVQPTRRGQGWGHSRASSGLAYIHSGRSSQTFIPHRQIKKSEGHLWISKPLKRLMKEKGLYYRKRHKPMRCYISKLKRVQQQVRKRFPQEY